VWIERTPSSVGADGARWGHALWVLTRHEFRMRYRAQALGLVWPVLNALVMVGLLCLVFTSVFRTTRALPIYMLIGLIVWEWLSSAATAASAVFVAHAETVKRTRLPRALLPLAVPLSFGANFLLESLVVVAFIPIFPDAFTLSPALLLVPIVLAFFVALLAGVALMVSVLSVVYRDVQYLVSTLLMIFYWLTPIVYPIDVVPEPARTVLRLNPLAGIIDGLRDLIMLGQAPSAAAWLGIAAPSLAVLGLGALIFRHYEWLVLDHV
jgi:ABC-type polysaccharide/polyol phosphate export permease